MFIEFYQFSNNTFEIALCKVFYMAIDSTTFMDNYNQKQSKSTTHLIFLACALPTGEMGGGNES